MNKKTTLILGDILAIAIITVIGFISHDEFDFPYISRMGTTFFPLLLSWFIAATWLDLFDERVISNPQLFWRILVAMLLAAPLAAILRAALLHSVAQPLFVLVLGGTAALGLLVWRGIYFLVASRIDNKM
jgi:hypothetical protein